MWYYVGVAFWRRYNQSVTSVQGCKVRPINFSVSYLGNIFYSDGQNDGFFFLIYSDHHLNSIYINYCCFWLFFVLICY